MKWTTQELVKLENVNNEINEVVDLSEMIKDTDIISMSPVQVSGDFEIYDQEEFVFYLNIKCTLTLPCAITLKEVKYEMNIETEEVFTFKENEDSNIIDGITIDLFPIVWSNILLEKPMRVLSENAYDNMDFENQEFEIDETENAFASLKNYKS